MAKEPGPLRQPETGPASAGQHGAQAPGHQVYPYLLRDVAITQPNQVWPADITYIPMAGGFLYLVAVMDWYSRYVLSWRLSHTLEADFWVEALEEALEQGCPRYSILIRERNSPGRPSLGS
jgi:transposase InsO family protein